MNIMKAIRLEKVTLNIGVGKPGPELDKAVKLLETISKQKPVQTKAHKRLPEWGLRPGLAIGSKVTIRGKKAQELLKRLLQAVDNKLLVSNFDKFGNLSFGIREYIEIPGVKYDVDIGIIGLEVAVTFDRPGFRIKKRQAKKAKIGKTHQLSKEETIPFMENAFGAKVMEK